ncbi:MAG: MurT ligase domain-containing protein [Acidimicrobiia bacterium]
MSPGAGAARAGAAGAETALRSALFRGARGPRFELAVGTARALRWLDRRTDTRIDTSRAGRALLAAAPDALHALAGRLPGGCALVTGTNGKTTTTHLLAGVLRAAGRDPVVNRAGANMPGGICADLVGAARRGRVAGDLGVFEVDELWLDRIVPPLVPEVLVLGNLFRDQLDRTGELDRVTRRWQDLVAHLPATTALVVNADDPRVCQLAAPHPRRIHVGLGHHDRTTPPVHADVPDCLRCGARLGYDGAHIGHLGRWSCPGCGDARPAALDVEATALDLDGLQGATFTLAVRGPTGATTTHGVHLVPPGRFNVANAVAAAGAALALGVAAPTIATGLSGTPSAFGRGEHLTVGHQALSLVLAKNPTGLDEVVGMLSAGEEPLDLLILLNDGELDGRDVSWIWDADLERLAPRVARVTCGGGRAAEMALRLDHAGIAPERIEVVDGIAAATGRALARAAGGPVVAVTNYSAMLDLRETLAERGHAARYWA